MWAKAINFQEFKAKKEKIQRIATIPRAFTFATQERSVQRSSNTLKATDSNIVEPVSSTWNKSNDSQHSSLVQDHKMPRVQRPNPAVQRTSDQLQTSTKTRATENQKRKDSPTTRRGPRESIPSKQKGSSLDAPKIDVFTRLYQSGNRRSQQTSLHSNKLHPKAQSETRQPVIFNTRSLPQLRSVSNFKSTKNKPREDKRQVEQSTSLPQYAFRSNSPIHNKCRRASRVPIAENEQVVELV